MFCAQSPVSLFQTRGPQIRKRERHTQRQVAEISLHRAWELPAEFSRVSHTHAAGHRCIFCTQPTWIVGNIIILSNGKKGQSLDQEKMDQEELSKDVGKFNLRICEHCLRGTHLEVCFCFAFLVYESIESVIALASVFWVPSLCYRNKKWGFLDLRFKVNLENWLIIP